MLARGILCRLAADVPKTSTHDLSQLSRLLQRSIRTRNAISIPSISALSHAYKLVLAESRRSYATARATKPTGTVKRAVKKTAAKKPAPGKKTAPKKTKKRTTSKRAKPKKKTEPKKKVAKKLTPEEKERKALKKVKEYALREPPRGVATAWTVLVTEAMKGTGASVRTTIKDAAAKLKNFTPAEKEHYNHLANQKSAENEKAYKAWVLSHTPDQIRLANIARRRLKRTSSKTSMTGRRVNPPNTRLIKDDRQLSPPLTPYVRFALERRQSGDMKDISLGDSGKLTANEWKSLSASEKRKYEDAYAADRETYKHEYQRVYGHPIGTRIPF
ncbi:hypothetical protein K469DRAFT_43218 [Zopfia rhizophila CBS 207.26]|uniref:HMG box domain-containing protein n=1 Tax=Zopfia rhizophila CBS 207.26 TaxID=1314779 RepID=A0A6A6EFF6_9PEZI|nr:hypothetical protein K469DRAFT_43218 [Zopfia rhizophila CBS 207.26]